MMSNKASIEKEKEIVSKIKKNIWLEYQGSEHFLKYSPQFYKNKKR